MHANLCTRILVNADDYMACSHEVLDLRSRGKNYSVQVFKTMQGVPGWTGPFGFVFAAYCYVLLVSRSFVLYNLQFA